MRLSMSGEKYPSASGRQSPGWRGGAAPLGWGDIGPLVDAKGAEVADAAGVGGQVVEGGEGGGRGPRWGRG